MSETRTNTTRWLLLAGFVCLIGFDQAKAAVSVPLTGAIGGTVRGPGGSPQIGASVTLFNHLQRQVGKVLTDEHGEFKLLGLFPAVYSVKISVAAFIPATRQILVQPGMRSILNVNLSTLFSSIQFGYPVVENANIMSEDWKWVLRSAPATRPVLRYVAIDANSTQNASDTQSQTAVSTAGHGTVFSDTRGLVNVSAGDGSVNAGVSTQADLGTTFALATSLYGNSLIQFSGNVGYGSATGTPATAFRTSYRRELAGGNPEVSLTVRQLMLPGRLAAAFAGPDGSGLALMRTMSAGFEDENKISDNLTLQYGFTLDVVSFLAHLNYYSPYARLTYSVDRNDDVIIAYTSGNGRPDLGATAGADPSGAPVGDNTLQRDVNALGVFPRMSMLDGRAEIQRGVEYEAVYEHRSGSRTYRASMYRQDISNTAMTVATPGGFFSGGDVMPDPFSNSEILNAGTFQNTGVAVSATQNLGSNTSVTVIYGDTGALTADPNALASHNPDELRSVIRQGRRQTLATRISATVPHSGTHLVASYQWTGSGNALMVGNLYSTAGMQPPPGMNIYVRQPIPGFGGRVEATADLRNILAQGYLPLTAADGQRILLVQNPRSVRGGLSFTF
jgi:Carboxypeptidase regulatory-like domain